MRELRRLKAVFEQRLRGITIPRPFDLEAFCQAVATHRGRPLYLHPLPYPAGPNHPYGLTISTDRDDHVFVEAATSPWHRDLIGCHELAHLLCGHKTADLTALLTSLTPDLDPDVVHNMLARRTFTDQQEREAELMASMILERPRREPSVPFGNDETLTRHLADILGIPARGTNG